MKYGLLVFLSLLVFSAVVHAEEPKQANRGIVCGADSNFSKAIELLNGKIAHFAPALTFKAKLLIGNDGFHQAIPQTMIVVNENVSSFNVTKVKGKNVMTGAEETVYHACVLVKGHK